MYRYVFEPRASDEYLAAIMYFKIDSKEIATKFVLEVEYTLKFICTFPQNYLNKYKNFREVSLKKFPFSIVYHLDRKNNIVVVISIFHHRRNPKIKYKK